MRQVAYKTWAQGRLARKNSPNTAPSASFPRKNSPSIAPPLALPRKSSPSKRKNADFGVFRACRANFFAHKARQRGDFDTDNTTAHPQQGTAETDITSAPENCTKNAHFSPAKAMTVSVEARSPPAKATTVSDNRPSWPTGPVCGTRGRRRALAGRPVGGRRYKRRQSEPKNRHFQRKSPRIDDVRNNGAEIHTKNSSD